MPGGPAITPIPDDGRGDPQVVVVNGERRNWFSLSEYEKREWRQDHPERYRDDGAQDTRVFKRDQEFESALDDVGLPAPGESSSNLFSALQNANVDTDIPEVQAFITATQAQLDAGALTPEAADAYARAIALNPAYQKTNPYLEALEAAGFDGPYDPQYSPGAQQLAARDPDQRGFAAGDVSGPHDPFEESELGWIQFANGVLVGPDGEVVIDPTSNAPGGARWLRGINDWSAERVKSEKARLVEFGYLEKGAAKSGEVTVDFRNALQAYHANRYINGGAPIRAEGSAAAGADRPKPVDLRDFEAQTRADVRDQYERIFGVRPDDGEVELWSDYIIRQGMALQRKNIKKYDTPMTGEAATEAEERFIEELESTPQARVFMEAEEENTRLRDTFTRMAQVTDSLAS